MWVAAVTSLLALVSASYPPSPPIQCELLTIPVTVSGVQQKNVTGPIDYATNPGAVYASFPDLTVSQTFNISASLCGPSTVNATRSSTLQILVHGATYNKTYWSGLELPPNSFNGSTYSWVDYAASQGYHTLAIDRLCNGNSSHPDAANVCQIQTQAAVIHELAKLARDGSLSPGSSPSFSSIVYVGHSLGSNLGAYFLNTYPGDADTAILTGYSDFSAPGTVSFTYSSGIQPAKDAFARFASLEPTYVAVSDQRTILGHFYYGDYNPVVPALDFRGSGTVALGEPLSFGLGLVTQPNVTVPIFVLNGRNDQIYCAVTIVDGFHGYGGDCGDGPDSLTARSSVLFPNAASYSYFNIPNTGHDINLHYSAPTGFAAAQQFLDVQGF